MNILIVESENDQYFVQALANLLNTSETEVCSIDDYKHSSLDKIKLKTQIGSALTTRDVLKVGIILDMDDSTLEDRFKLVNEALIDALKDNFDTDFVVSTPLKAIKEFIEISIGEFTKIHFCCYFTNVEGSGELETLFKAIKTQDSTFADCILEGWQNCIQEKGKKVVRSGEKGGDIKDKELLKLWVDFYKRFDTLKKSERNEDLTDWKGIWLGQTSKKGKIVTPRGSNIFNLESEVLKDVKDFLLLFNPK